MLHFCHTFQIIRLVLGIHNRQLSTAKNPMSFQPGLSVNFKPVLQDLGLAI